MPSEVYANYAMGPLQVSVSFRFKPPNDFLCHMLVSAMVFALCLQVPMWLSCLPMGTEPLGFETLQPFRVYTWQAYVPVVMVLAHARSAVSGCSSHCLK